MEVINYVSRVFKLRTVGDNQTDFAVLVSDLLTEYNFFYLDVREVEDAGVKPGLRIK